MWVTEIPEYLIHFNGEFRLRFVDSCIDPCLAEYLGVKR